MDNDIYVNYSYSDLKNLIDRSNTPGEFIMANGVMLKSWSNLISVISKCGRFRKLLTETCQVKISIDGKLSGSDISSVFQEEQKEVKESVPEEETQESIEPLPFGPDENAQYLGNNIYIVRTQAGFRKALKNFGWSREMIIDSYPSEYPSLVSLSLAYRGYIYVTANCISVKRCLSFLSLEVKK